MSVTVARIDKITNVVATLTPGGTLLPNTTYYIRVCCNNSTDATSLPLYYLSSPPSDEISFTTDTTNLSANITWDVPTVYNAVSGTEVVRTYDVYIRKDGETYRNTGSNVGKKCGPPNPATQHTSTTNSYAITSESTAGGYDLLGYAQNSENLPFNMSREAGVIYVILSGTETIANIYTAINAVVPASAYFNGIDTYCFIGSIFIQSGTSGSLINSGGNLYFFPGIGIYNNSTSFTVSFTRTEIRWIAYARGYDTRNSTYIGCIFNPNFSVDYYPRFNGAGFSNVVFGINSVITDCTFYRLANYYTNFSNNTVYAPGDRFRLWFSGDKATNTEVKNAKINCLYMDRYSSPSATMEFYDSEIIFQSHFVYTGGWDRTPTKFVDCKFKDKYENCAFNFSGVISPNNTINFYNSINLTVKDTNGNPVVATLKVYDKDGNLTNTATTDANGLVSANVLVIMAEPTNYNSATPGATIWRNYNNFSFTIEADGYENYSQTPFELRSKFTSQITLIPVLKTHQSIEGEILIAHQPELGSRAKVHIIN